MTAPRQAPRTTVFTNIRPLGVRATDLTVVNGRFVRERPRDGGPVTTVDCGGLMALPSLVDAHIHPDKTSWGEPWFARRPAEGIADYAEQDVELHRRLPTPVHERARRLMAHAAALGTRGMRAHADIGPAYGLENAEALNSARGALSHALDVQTVGFPQHGVHRAPGTAELLEEAARGGLLDHVGGIDPAGFDGDLKGQLDTVFGLAERHRLGVDIHLHDRGDKGLAPLREIIARTRALGMRGRVTVSHAFCVADLAGRELDDTAEQLAEAGVSLTTVAPDSVRVLPFARLRRHGVRVGVGSDGVRDSWSPYGNGDMLYRAHLLGFVTDARLDAELEDCYLTAAHDGAALTDLPAPGFDPGDPADFFLADGECLPQAVVDMPHRTKVVRAGEVIAENGTLLPTAT